MINSWIDLGLLFVTSFLAATILPAQSEALLAGLYLSGDHINAILILVATFGNVLGSCVNWLLGRYLLQWKDKKWFFVKPDSLEKATNLYKKYGTWTLLFAWVPFIGDPITVVAGFLRTNFYLFLALVTIGKFSRYVVVIAILS